MHIAKFLAAKFLTAFSIEHLWVAGSDDTDVIHKSFFLITCKEKYYGVVIHTRKFV